MMMITINQLIIYSAFFAYALSVCQLMLAIDINIKDIVIIIILMLTDINDIIID